MDTAPLFAISEADYESHSTLRLTIERGGRTRSQLIRGDFPSAPMAARRQLGSAAVDYTDMSLCVVTKAFRNAVSHHGLTGVVFAPLDVEGDGDGWFLVGVTGRCGPFDYSRSEHFEKTIPNITGGEGRSPYLRGFRIDPATCSGHDFLLPPKVDQVIVTQKVVDGLSIDRLTNVRFTPVGEYEIEENTALGKARSVPGLR